MSPYSAWASFLANTFPNGLPSTTFWPPRSTYSPERDIPDLTGKVVLITGGASGIGYAASRELLKKGAQVYIAGRNSVKVAEAIATLERETGKAAHALQLDLEDLDRVKLTAEEFLGKEQRLDILYCNAGLMNPPAEQLTKQGYDLQFGTNVARVVHTSSGLYAMAPKAGIDWDSLKAGPARDQWLAKRGHSTTLLYNQSKLGNILVANSLHRSHSSSVVSISVHPGLIRSQLGRHSPAFQDRMLDKLRWPAELGAVGLLFAGTSAGSDELGGTYVIPWGRVGELNELARDERLQDRLEAWLREEVKAWP